MSNSIETILKSAGYPESTLVVDFETYFDESYNLDNLMTDEYIADPKFQVLGVAIKFNQSPATFLPWSADIKSQFDEWDWSNITVIMHNTKFDFLILAEKYKLFPRFIIDTKDLACAYDSDSPHSLKELAERWKLGHKGETMDFCGENWDSDKLPALAEYAKNDAELTHSLLTRLLPLLDNPHIELPIAAQTRRFWTHPALHCDKMLGKILIEQMEHEQGAAIKRLGLKVEDISVEKNFLWHLEQALDAAGDLVQRYVKITKRGYALALAQGDSARDLLLNHPSQRVRDLCEAKIGRRSWPLHINRVKRILRGAEVAGGKIRVGLQYFGAHTGRDTGMEKRNLQNLPKRGNHLLTAMRGLLVAPPGYRLVRMDLNAIEARTIGWLAGQRNMLADFSAYDSGTDKYDIYQKFASICLDKPVTHVTDEDRNSIGKIGVLGCGYGMGPYLPGDRSKPNVMFLENKLDLKTAEKIVDTYRRAYPAVVNLWNELERAARYTLTKAIPATLGRLTLYTEPNVPLVIKLPSGRLLRYHNARLSNNYLHLGNLPIWGGFLAENVTQATARDVLMEGSIAVEAAGIEVVHRVHDEIICLAALPEVQCVAKQVRRILCSPPKWATDLPLNGKVKIAYRYGA